MAIFHVQSRQETDSVALCELLNYIRNPLATAPDLVYGTNIMFRYPYDEMMFVKACHASPVTRTWQGRQFYDFVVSLPEEESRYLGRFRDCMVAINTFIATFSGGHYQVIHAVHINTDNLHAHIVMNNIDMFTGARFDLGKRAFYELRDGVDAILQEHGFSGIGKSKCAA